MSYIIAHRANGGKYKGNTKEAILDVLNYSYVDGIEIDISMTKDGKFIIHHNSFLICQDKRIINISNTTYKKLKKCKNIILLEDVLKDIKTNKLIFLDLKYTGNIKKWLKLINILENYPNNYNLISFSYYLVTIIKNKYPKYKTYYLKGYLINLEKKKNNLDSLAHYSIYKDEKGIWTVNLKKDILKYKNKDIIIITDNPKYAS